MGTIYIDRKDVHIKLDGDALTFYVNGTKEGQAPIYPLKRVVIVGSVTIDTKVLHRLANDNISVIFLTGKNLRFGGMLHGFLHNNAIIRLKQYEATKTDFPVQFSKNLVCNKIKSQIEFLTELIDLRKDLRNDFITAIKTLLEITAKVNLQDIGIDSVRGYEGGAAAVYFDTFTKLFPASLNFNKRTKRPPEDPVNALLSLCYTILHFEMVREIQLIGLDPTIGFYHTFEYGRESLACDFVEPFRVKVDKFVWQLFKDRTFTKDDFSNEKERAGCYLKKQSRAKFYPILEEWLTELRPQLRSYVRNFTRSIADEEDIISEQDN